MGLKRVNPEFTPYSLFPHHHQSDSASTVFTNSSRPVFVNRVQALQKHLDVFSQLLFFSPSSLCNTVDKSDYMVGSYGPRPDEAYEFLSTMEEAPKGMLARGTYNIKSKFTDDDKHDHLSWEWSLTIKKDWKD